MYAVPAEVTQWRSGLTELNQGWLEQDGDQIEWSHQRFNDSTWNAVDLGDLGPAQPGWRWYRRQVNFGPDRRCLRLLIAGGEGTFELFVNGARVPGATLRSSLLVGRPAETVFPLSDPGGIFQIALRTRIPPGYAAWHLPQFTNVTIGLPTAIDYERQALKSQRLDGLAPSICINLLLCLAGFGSLGLFAIQRTEREYVLLGLYLSLAGISGGLSILQSTGLAPLSANFLIADPLIYACIVAQIEFTYKFAGRRVDRVWRVYEISLLVPLALAALTWTGRFASDTYVLIEAAATAPVGLLLSVVLLAWYRRGNAEAGWLILPSLAPAVSNALFDLGTASISMGWRPFNFLVEPIQIGPSGLQLVDAGTLAYLLSIAVVMFFRFGRVSREHARTAAELAAAREIQRRLVPEVLQVLPHYAIEAAYLPAQEVGGDFYQVLPHHDGSILIVVGDVSGKGLKAAMTGALAIGALRTLAAEISSPSHLLSRLNREILREQDGGFITCLCVKIDPDGQMTISNAGHLPPYINGEELPLESGLPLGLVPDSVYPELRVDVKCHDSLTLLSDGVVEARSPKGELFGFERTKAVSGRSAHDIAAAAQQFGQEDDITVLRLRHIPIGPCRSRAD
ncbi:MAG TPA: PP2C family protein-serine/threonine phosphatase [Terracidiphilus sp.]|nr:PP2C family protein-serine/threonine phosphatase [Terracidiphilus sp.]